MASVPITVLVYTLLCSFIVAIKGLTLCARLLVLMSDEEMLILTVTL